MTTDRRVLRLQLRQARRNAERVGTAMACAAAQRHVMAEMQRLGDELQRQMQQRQRARERLREAGFDDEEIPL